MLSKEFRDQCFKEFFGHKEVHGLMFALEDNRFLPSARWTVEDEIEAEKQSLNKTIDEIYTVEMHNRTVERIKRLQLIDYTITKELEKDIPGSEPLMEEQKVAIDE